MMKYIQILNVYLQNRMFVTLSVLLVLCAVTSKCLYFSGYAGIAESFSTLLFVATLWIAIHLGMMIKHQLANHRASMLPGYRGPHILCATLIFLFYVVAAILWEQGLVLMLQITPDGLVSAYMGCLLVALFIVYLGYLSIGRLFIYFYVFALLVAMNGSNILAGFESNPAIKYYILGTIIIFGAFFMRRLLTLKEHHIEYPYLLSWPPKNYFVNQLNSERVFAPFKDLLKLKSQDVSVPDYPRVHGSLMRATHWDYVDRLDLRVIGVILILLTPVFLLLAKNNSLFVDIFSGAYSNFLLLSLTPVIVTLGSCYKKLAYCEYDLLKPVTREQYYKERGIILLWQLLGYWLIFAVCFAILPNIIYSPELFASVKFWMFLLLTANVALMLTVWLVWLACISNQKAVLVSGFALSNVLMFQFYYSEIFSVNVIFVSNLLCVGIILILIRKAFRAWCQKEFV